MRDISRQIYLGPTVRPDGPSGGWVYVIALAVFAGFVLFVRLPAGNFSRIVAMVLPAIVVALLAMYSWRWVRLPVRILGVAAAILLAIPAFVFVPAAGGVNYWTAQAQLAELRDPPKDTAELKRLFERCQIAARDFPEINAAMDQCGRDWKRDKLKEAEDFVWHARRGKAAEAMRSLDVLERDSAEIGVPILLGRHRQIVKEWLVTHTLLPRLKALDGKDRAEFRRIREERAELAVHEFTEPDLGRQFHQAEIAWAVKAAQAAAREAEELAKTGKLTEANGVLKKARQEVAGLTTRDVNDVFDAATERVVEVVWQQRIKALDAVAPGDFAEFRKQQERCQELTKEFPYIAPALAKAEGQWIDKSARAAAAKADALKGQAKLDEAHRLFKSTWQELLAIGRFADTSAEKVFFQGYGDLLDARLQKAAMELKSLQEASKIDDISKLAVQIAREWQEDASTIGKEEALTAFVNRCADVVAADDCRAVEALLAKGESELDAAALRMKQIVRAREDLLKLPGAKKAAADYLASRRKVVEAHLAAAQRQIGELETTKQSAAVIQKALGLRKAWEAEADIVGVGDQVRKVLTAVGEKHLQAAVEQADASLNQKEYEAAFGQLQAVSRDWQSLENDKTLAAARQRVAVAILADARVKLTAFVEAEDYAAVVKLKQGLDQKKELVAWGAGPNLQAFMQQCGFLIDLAIAGGKLPKQ